MIPKLIFTYGFTASGKTTWCKEFLNNIEHNETKDSFVYLSADEIRQELYGSPDRFGNPEEIYKVILDRMINSLKNNKNVIYDACNLYYSYRMDYLNPIKEQGIECYKTIVRFNTVKETCLKRHVNRNRNFDINKIIHYFDINEPPTMEEGWDFITDICDQELFEDYKAKYFYIASPFFQDKERKNAIAVAEYLRSKGHKVCLPCEHKFENAWDMPNYEWGKAVFEYDINQIINSDIVVCLSYGRMSSAGTNFEAGYAFGIGRKVIVVEMEDTSLMSLMLMNGCHAVVKGLEGLYEYDFDALPRCMDYKMEQK